MSLLPEINQASAEINKLVAQANIHQTIAPVNPAAFTDPADTMLLASRDPVIREVSVGMTGVEAASYTVSGTPPLSLPNSLGEPLKALSVDVSPYQEGTGDPSPSNVRPIHGTDKLNLFVEESYVQSATPKAVLTLPQTVYTGTYDFVKGELVAYYKTKVYKGDENWSMYGSFFYIPVDDMKIGNYQQGLCDTYKTQLTAGCSDPSIRFGGNDHSVYVYNTGFASTTDFKSFLSSNNVTTCYPLATPLVYHLDPSTVTLPKGDCTAWATAEVGTVDSMSVTYVGKA